MISVFSNGEGIEETLLTMREIFGFIGNKNLQISKQTSENIFGHFSVLFIDMTPYKIR